MRARYKVDLIAIAEFPDGTAGQVGISLHNRLPNLIDRKFALPLEEFNAAIQRSGSVDLHVSDWTHLNQHADMRSPANFLPNVKSALRRETSWIVGSGAITVTGKRGLVGFEGGAIDKALPRFFEVAGPPTLLDGLRFGDFVDLEFFGTRARAEVMQAMTTKGAIFVEAAPLLRALARTFNARLRGLT
jgi:hypothetical protein